MNPDFYFSQDFEKMEAWGKLLDLTHTLWRVADITIDGDILRSRIKQYSCDILEQYPNAVCDPKGIETLVNHINSLIALLSLAQKVSRSKEINFLILKNEYRKIIFSLSQKLLTESHSAVVDDSTEAAVSEKSKPADAVEVKNEPVKTPPVRQKSVVDELEESLSERQLKMMQFFQKKKKDKIKLKDIAQFFPELTDRTIRNDLKDLCVKKIVSRTSGHGQASFYYLNPNHQRIGK